MWMQWGIYTGPPGAKFRNLAAAEQSMLIAQATVKCALMPMWRVLNFFVCSGLQLLSASVIYSLKPSK